MVLGCEGQMLFIYRSGGQLKKLGVEPLHGIPSNQGSNCEQLTGRVSNTAGTKGLGVGGHNGMNRGTGGGGGGVNHQPPVNSNPASNSSTAKIMWTAIFLMHWMSNYQYQTQFTAQGHCVVLILHGQTEGWSAWTNWTRIILRNKRSNCWNGYRTKSKWRWCHAEGCWILRKKTRHTRPHEREYSAALHSSAAQSVRISQRLFW